eukprot:scaffold29486_cov61-Cyclotella_meneghiniana.AAC.3
MAWMLQQKQAADQDSMIAARSDGRGEGNSSHGMIEKHIQRAVRAEFLKPSGRTNKNGIYAKNWV